MNSRPKGMSYAKACSSGLIKAEDMDEDSYNKLPEKDEDEDEKEMSKSVHVQGLLKSIDAYSRVASAAAAPDRRTFLLSRAAEGAASASEEAELARILGGSQRGMAKSLVEEVYTMADDQGREILDAQTLVSQMFGGISNRLEALQKSMEQGSGNTRAILHAQGELIKSMAGLLIDQERRLGHVERTPVAPRGITRATGHVRELGKNTGGGGGEEPAPLTKSLAMQGLNRMAQKALASRDTMAHQRITHAIAKLELGQGVDPEVQNAIRVELGNN